MHHDLKFTDANYFMTEFIIASSFDVLYSGCKYAHIHSVVNAARCAGEVRRSQEQTTFYANEAHAYVASVRDLAHKMQTAAVIEGGDMGNSVGTSVCVW